VVSYHAQKTVARWGSGEVRIEPLYALFQVRSFRRAAYIINSASSVTHFRSG
jgi:hypothetical protein